MSKNKVYSILLFICLSCQNSTLTKKKNVSNSFSSDTLSQKVTDFDEMYVKDTTGFLSNCQNRISGSSMGYLQEVPSRKDSLGAFCFYECYDCKETFEIVFIHKNKQGPDTDNSVWDEFEKSCHNNFSNFNCFAFVYPMRDPDKQKDIHAMNIDFPVMIKAYERITNDNWKFVKEIKAKKFKEFSLFQFKTIYHLHS